MDNQDLRWVSYSMACLWLWSGLVSLAPSAEISLALLAKLGVMPAVRLPMLAAASAWDLALGVAGFTAWRRRAGFWYVQAATIVVYSLIVLIFLPEYVWHPFAPLMKNLPILAMVLVAARWARGEAVLKGR